VPKLYIKQLNVSHQERKVVIDEFMQFARLPSLN